MRRAASFHSNQVAVISGDRQLTFREAWERGIRLANGLLEAGLRPGDRVAALEDNELAAADYFLGTAIGNFVRVPLYRRNARAGHRYMLEHTQCRALVVG